MTETIKNDQYYVDLANAFVDQKKYVDALRVFVDANKERPAHKNMNGYMTEFIRKMLFETEDALNCLMLFVEAGEQMLASLMVRKYPNLTSILMEQGKMEYVGAIASWMHNMKNVVCSEDTGISKRDCYFCTLKQEVTCCASCGENGKGRMKTCGDCFVAHYCDKKCQKAHWVQHKKLCKEASFLMYAVKRIQEENQV